VNQSYSNADILGSSLTLASAGTGSVAAIVSIPPKSAVEVDTDGNGIQDVPACFAGADLARLFDHLSGRQAVEARLTGSLRNDRQFCTAVTLNLVPTGKPLAVTVAPNPLNPSGTVSFSTPRSGFIRIRLYDLHGRVVRTIADATLAPAGPHEYKFDGRNDRGVPIATGVYFYRLETPDGTTGGRIAILR
jgi:hypothetical protein